jgi:hypothetical protein
LLPAKKKSADAHHARYQKELALYRMELMENKTQLGLVTFTEGEPEDVMNEV